MANELTITVPEDDKIQLVIFTSKDGLEPFLKTIRDEIDAFKPDISTAKGREEIKSMAYKVSRSKTLLDGVGEKLYSQYKEIPEAIQASRRELKRKLDGWRDEVRKPLTEWEDKEEARKKKHLDALAAIKKLMSANASESSETLRGYKARLNDLCPKSPEDCEEFEGQYKSAANDAFTHIFTVLAAAEKREADAAELELIRAENKRLEEEKRKAEEESRRAQEEAGAAVKREREAKQAAELARKREEEANVRREEMRQKIEEDQKMRLREIAKAKQEAEEREKKAAEAAREEERRRLEKEAEERAAYELKIKDAHARIAQTIQSITDEVIRIPDWCLRDLTNAVISAITSGKIPHLKIEV